MFALAHEVFCEGLYAVHISLGMCSFKELEVI